MVLFLLYSCLPYFLNTWRLDRITSMVVVPLGLLEDWLSTVPPSLSSANGTTY